jgi:ketosteroid isomerase-like protein
MSASEALEVVRRILGVYSGDMAATFRDPERLAAAREITDPLFHPDVVVNIPAETDGSIAFPSGKMRGVETFVAMWQEWFEVFESLDQVHMDIELLPDGRVTAKSETTVHLSTGQTATFPGLSIWKVEDGRVTWVAFGANIPGVRAAAGL